VAGCPRLVAGRAACLGLITLPTKSSGAIAIGVPAAPAGVGKTLLVGRAGAPGLPLMGRDDLFGQRHLSPQVGNDLLRLAELF
jgi:hypothetical protein